ncbi:hypothetical protein [Vibrio vulnificus]|uniref:hypothetical protein n=1 Tax=Vibrio vulnificus TaxID=672 RepID=UPI001CDBB954|nr:hypothetical protein [Vibrio vulnificus]MCA3989536.1 hypothetical protein [Vibrio vulnificus]
METVSVDLFVPKLRQLVNVALPPLMHSALAQAAQEFCRESGLVRYTRTFDNVSAGDVIAVVGSSDLNSGSGSYLASHVISVADSEHAALIKGVNYRQMSRDVLSFITAHPYVEIHCSIEPGIHTQALPKLLLDEYAQAICFGAAHLLLLQPDSDWHNPSLAGEYRQWFVEAMRSAKRFALESGEPQPFSNPIRKREFF